MKRIGVDVRCFAGGKTTGVEEYTKQFLTHVFENDTENTYVLFFNAYRGMYVDFSWATHFDNVELRVFHVPNKILNGLIWYAQRPKIDKMLDGVDAFFMPNINFISLSDNVPLYLTIHDLSFEHYKSTFSWKRRMWHWFVHPRALVRKAEHVFAVSEATARDLMATYDVDEEKVSVVRSALPDVGKKISRNDHAVLDVREKYVLPRRFFLYFGTLEPRKNVAGIIRAYTIFRDRIGDDAPALVLAGTPGWKSHVITRALKDSPYADDIHTIHAVPVADKQALYMLATCFLYPSFFEGFGFPPLEAFTADTPVIASHTSSLPEVVGKHAVMIDPWRTEELVHALYDHCTSQKALPQSERESAYKKHMQNFTWRTAVDHFLQKIRK